MSPEACSFILYKTSQMWFLIVRKTHLETTLAITAVRVICSEGLNRDREKIRFLKASVKIDFAGIVSLINDLLW